LNCQKQVERSCAYAVEKSWPHAKSVTGANGSAFLLSYIRSVNGE
jgi:hypothetical protein